VRDASVVHQQIDNIDIIIKNNNILQRKRGKKQELNSKTNVYMKLKKKKNWSVHLIRQLVHIDSLIDSSYMTIFLLLVFSILYSQKKLCILLIYTRRRSGVNKEA
jgi:hypothetical protein